MGANDYKKGNRTKGRRDTTAMVAITKDYAGQQERWRKMAEARRESCTYTQEWATELYSKVMGYVKECLNSYDPETGKYKKAITRAGMQLASGVLSTDKFYKIMAGDYDYRLEEYIDLKQIDIDSIEPDVEGIKWYFDDQNRAVALIPFGEILQKAYLLAEAEAEQSMHVSGRITELSRLNVVHGWREEKAATTTNNTLVIGGEEEAKHILELLK